MRDKVGSSIEMLCHTKWLAPAPLPSEAIGTVATLGFFQDPRPGLTAACSEGSRGRFQARTESSTLEQWTGSESTRLGFFQGTSEQKTAVSTMKLPSDQKKMTRSRRENDFRKWLLSFSRWLGGAPRRRWENDFCHFLVNDKIANSWKSSLSSRRWQIPFSISWLAWGGGSKPMAWEI